MFLFSGSSSASTIFLCASFGSLTSTLGTSPLRAMDLRVPSASVRMTRKSSLRTSLPSSFDPSAHGDGYGIAAPPPPRPAAGEWRPATRRPSAFCSARGLGTWWRCL